MATKDSATAMVEGITKCRSQKLPDDLIREIILRCNLRTVYTCKCVSKDWNCMLSAPSFRLAYICLHEKLINDNPPPPLLGFFHFKGKAYTPRGDDDDDDSGSLGFSFLTTDLEGEPIYSLEFLNKINRGHFHCVSNGLVLCGDYPNLHVFNPITRQICSLPMANFIPENLLLDNLEYSAASPGFISSQFDNDFKVIVPFYTPKVNSGFEKAFVDIYSSKAGLWTQSELVAVARFQICATVLSPSFDGTCFWFTSRGCIVAYNPCSDDKRVQLIKQPPTDAACQTPSLWQSRDGYLQCAVDDCRLPGFRVYVLGKTLPEYGYEDVVGRKEWAVTYVVQLDLFNPVQTGLHRPVLDHLPYHYRRIFIAGFHLMNPRILYFRLGKRIFSCDVEKIRVRQIPYGGDLYSGSTEKLSFYPYVQLLWPPSPLANP